MAEFYSKYDNLRNNIKWFFNNLFLNIRIGTDSIIKNILDHKGIYILLASIIIFLISGDYIFPFVWATVLYILTLAYKYLDHKKEKELLELIEFDQFKELDKILDLYIEECYNRDVGFFHPNIMNDYVSEKEQIALMQELKDSVASNMSRTFRKKLELYYGDDRLGSILSSKCFIYITLLAAGNNRVIYQQKPINTNDKK